MTLYHGISNAYRQIAAVCAILLFCLAPAWAGVTVEYQIINGFPVKYVAVNLNDPEVVVTAAVADNYPHGPESWESFLARLHPDAAINGTYFCPHSFLPVGDLVIEGTPIYRGVAGTALCILPDGSLCLRPGPRQAKANWGDCRTVVCAGPCLIKDGAQALAPRLEGFRDPHVLGSATRSALAYRRDGTLLLLTIEKNISLGNLANVCQALGACQALALDGGSASGLYANGRTLTRPARQLVNVIAVYTVKQRQAQFAARLYPGCAGPWAPRVMALAPPHAPAPHPVSEVRSVLSLFSPLAAPSGGETLAAPPDPAPEPDAVHLTQPAPRAPLAGQVVIAATAPPAMGVDWCAVTIAHESQIITTVIRSNWPLAFTWNSADVPDGQYTLEIKAYGADQQVVGRDQRLITVRNAAAGP